ncbi:MAG: peptidylprolyl isomerase [Planctomycetes bacterium]|nr:peptidylprolyl isomerase [Planctomycetota bacterium]
MSDASRRLRLLAPIAAFLLLALVAGLLFYFRSPAQLAGSPAPSPPSSPGPEVMGLLDGEPIPIETFLLALGQHVDLSVHEPKSLAPTRGVVLIRELEEKHGKWQIERAFDRAVYAALADRAIKKAGVTISRDAIEALLAREAAAFRDTADGQRFESYTEYLQQTGRSVALRKEELRRELGLDRVLGDPDEATLRAEFAELHDHYSGRKILLRHLLLKKEAQAKALLRRAEAGEKFATLAKAHSTEASTAKKGGLVAWIRRRGDVPEPLAALAFGLPIGEPGGPVKTVYGWHLVLVDAERPGKEVDFASTKADLTKVVRQRRRVEFMKAERAEAKIKPLW